MTDTIDRDELLRELTKRRKKAEHDRNLGNGFYKMGYMDGFDDVIMIVMGIMRYCPHHGAKMEDKNA